VTLDASHQLERILDVSMTEIPPFDSGDRGNILTGHVSSGSINAVREDLLPAPKAWAGLASNTMTMKEMSSVV